MVTKKAFRPDQSGTHRAQFDKNKKKIYATQTICGICGQPVDMHLKWPDPMSKTVDHIIPVAKGGHPSAIENLQLAHFKCNRLKSDKLFREDKASEGKVIVKREEDIGNRILPQSMNWKTYRAQRS